MFDAKNEPHEFVGENKQEAVAKACQFFGAEEGDLRIKGFEAGEVYGIGGRTVIIAERADRVPSSGRSDEDRRPRDRDRGDRPDRGSRPDRGERGRGRGRGQNEREAM